MVEREAWKIVTVEHHKGKSVTDTLKTLRYDALFWTTHTNARPNTITNKRRLEGDDGHFESPVKKTRGERRFLAKQSARDAQAERPQNGKGKGKGKKGDKKGDKGSGKGSKQWPKGWAVKDPKGKKFCSAYHLHNACKFGASCRDSHLCPVQKDGWTCNRKGHSPSDCPFLK